MKFRIPTYSRNSWLQPGWIVVCGVIGWHWAESNRSSPVPATSVVRLQPKPQLKATKTPSGISYQSWMTFIRNAGSPSQQTAAAALLAAQLTPSQWPEVLENLTLFSPEIVKKVLAQSIAARWSETDPAGAAAWALKHHDHRIDLIRIAAAAWVKKDQASATAWFEGLTDDQRVLAHTGFYQGLIRQDPEACKDMILARQNDPGFQRPGWLLGMLAEQNLPLTLDLANTVTEPELRIALLHNAVRRMAFQDLSKTLAWVQQQPDADELRKQIFRQSGFPPITLVKGLAQLTAEEQNSVLQSSGSLWDEFKPLDMLEALKKAPAALSPEIVSRLLRGTIGTLVRQDPAAARQLLEKEWGHYSTAWIPTLSYHWATLDPAAAKAWLEELPEGAAKEKAIARQLQMDASRNDQLKPLNESQADSCLRLLNGPDYLPKPPLATLTPETLEEVWQKSAALAEEQRAKIRGTLIEFQSNHTPAMAAAWISQAESSPATVEQASRLAATWVMNDAPAATSWALSLPEGETRTWAVWNLARQWSRLDPPAAGRWLEKIPDEATRELVAGAFTNQRPAVKKAAE